MKSILGKHPSVRIAAPALRRRAWALLCVPAVLLAVSCRTQELDDEELPLADNPLVTGGDYRLSLTFSEEGSRAAFDYTALDLREKRIDNALVALFTPDAAGAPAELYRVLSPESLTLLDAGSGMHDLEAKFTLPDGCPAKLAIVVGGNALGLYGKVKDLVPGTSYDTYCRHLTLPAMNYPASDIAAIADETPAICVSGIAGTDYKGHVPDDSDPLPFFGMWGETTPGNLFDTSRKFQAMRIVMLRDLARIDVMIPQYVVRQEGENVFSLESVFFYRPESSRLLVPRPGNVKRVLNPGAGPYELEGVEATALSIPSAGGADTRLPAGEGQAVPHIGWEAPGLVQRNVVLNPEEPVSERIYGDAVLGSVYVPEADVAMGSDGDPSGPGWDNRPALVVGGRYRNSSQTTYYRVDFTEGDPESPRYGRLADLLRNHRYRIMVTGVAGGGAPTPDEAYLTQHAAITYKVQTWEDTGTSYIAFDGEHWFEVGSKNIRTAGAVGSNISVPVGSDLPVSDWEYAWADWSDTEPDWETAEWHNAADTPAWPADGNADTEWFRVQMPGVREGSYMNIQPLRPLEAEYDASGNEMTEINPETGKRETIYRNRAFLLLRINQTLRLKVDVRQLPMFGDDWINGGDVVPLGFEK